MHKNDCFEQKNLNKLDKYDIIDITNDIPVFDSWKR